MPTGRAYLMSILRENLQRWVRDTPDRVALWSRSNGERLTFRELASLVDEWSRTFRDLEEECVAVATGNGIAFPALVLALVTRGIPAVLMDGALDLGEKKALCRRLGIRRLLHRNREGVEVGRGVLRSEIPGVEAVEPPRDTAVVKLTSGSTGEPRGVCLDERALLRGIRQIGEGMQIDSRDRVLIAIPLSHSYGFDNGVLSLVVLGTPLVFEPGFFPAPLLSALEEAEITFFPTVPPLVRSLAGSDWPSDLALRTVISAGGPLDAESAERFHHRSGRPVHQFYGSTETGGITYEGDPAAPEAAGTVGHPLPGVEVTLGPGARVQVDSRANFGAHLGEDRVLEDRIVATGDTGEWTEEGRLRLTGRTEDFLNVGGRRISIRAVEKALRQVDFVDDAAVVGVADPIRGDRIVAFVVSERDELDLSPVPRGLCPREVHRVDELPYTPRGKLDRRHLQRMARGSSS